MSTMISFSPVSTSTFQFQCTLDNNSYNVIVTWNLYGQRYYINIYDSNNGLILCVALIGSPDNYDISMTAGYFTTKLVFRQSSGNFEVI